MPRSNPSMTTYIITEKRIKTAQASGRSSVMGISSQSLPSQPAIQTRRGRTKSRQRRQGIGLERLAGAARLWAPRDDPQDVCGSDSEKEAVPDDKKREAGGDLGRRMWGGGIG